MMLASYLERLPLVAILRGVTPDEVLPIGRALVNEGFAIIEVPLNSPRPLESVRLLADALGDRALVGAGTVMTVAHVDDIKLAGGRIVVMPHSDPVVVRAVRAAGLVCMPGIATPTEGFSALANGADALKLFPAELLSPTVLKAMRSVFPADAKFFPVGGITTHNMKDFVEAGASGFGLGSALYRRGDDVDTVRSSAREFVRCWRALSA
jgi:2-dehydro-3-deoxyphosphogalactonate aldolase